MSALPLEPSERVRRLLPRHFKIIDLAIAGHDVKAIAQTVGMSSAAIGKILSSPLVQMEISRKRSQSSESEILTMDREATLGKARSLLEQASEYAALKHVELLEAPNHSIQLRAADKILERVFGKSSDDRRSLVVNITAEQGALLNLALKESDNVHRMRLPSANSDPASDPQEPSGQELVHHPDGDGQGV